MFDMFYEELRLYTKGNLEMWLRLIALFWSAGIVGVLFVGEPRDMGRIRVLAIIGMLAGWFLPIIVIFCCASVSMSMFIACIIFPLLENHTPPPKHQPVARQPPAPKPVSFDSEDYLRRRYRSDRHRSNGV
jgi:hypothetical protein